VRFGIERGELRSNLDQEMTVSIIDWTMERFQDALVTEELDPGLFRRSGGVAEKKETRIAAISGHPAKSNRFRKKLTLNIR